MVKKIVLRIWSNLNRYVVIELPMFLTLIALTGYNLKMVKLIAIFLPLSERLLNFRSNDIFESIGLVK